MTRHHFTARRGIGLSEILACGDDSREVAIEALKVERHPTLIEVLPGATCGKCGYRRPDPISDAW
jgi:Na+-translocating ferredoxin:NAD+ oxidoreductase RNF subunit RnfB